MTETKTPEIDASEIELGRAARGVRDVLGGVNLAEKKEGSEGTQTGYTILPSNAEGVGFKLSSNNRGAITILRLDPEGQTVTGLEESGHVTQMVYAKDRPAEIFEPTPDQLNKLAEELRAGLVRKAELDAATRAKKLTFGQRLVAFVRGNHAKK